MRYQINDNGAQGAKLTAIMLLTELRAIGIAEPIEIAKGLMGSVTEIGDAAILRTRGATISIEATK